MDGWLQAVCAEPAVLVTVAIVGLLTPGSGALLRELTAALGPDVSFSAPDAFAIVGMDCANPPIPEGFPFREA